MPLHMPIKMLTTVAGPLAAAAIGWWTLAAGLAPAASITAAVTLWCVIWWIFEPIPIPATSLLPLAVFPLFGILSKDEVASAYGSPIILLLLGGFILSRAMERSGTHRRLALYMVNLLGGHSSRRLVLGFMLAAALLSMWISNTATTLMLLPVAVAVMEKSPDPKLPIPLLLGTAYAASLGGVGTPIGTPPNLIFMQVYAEHTGTEITFLQWMRWGVSAVVLFLPLMGWWLTRNLGHSASVALPSVGRWRTEEKRVLIVFAATALAWITRQEPFGGWSGWLGLDGASDASVALLAVVALFLVPDGKGGRLMDWDYAATIPWGVLILFGGGICIAKAFMSSGLGQVIGDGMTGLALLPVLGMMLAICLGVTFMTETTSNTASATLLMPILAAAAAAVAIDPRLLMVPAAMSASCAFMLPVATAPNTIVYSSGRVPTRAMAREGVVLNFVGALVIASVCWLWF